MSRFKKYWSILAAGVLLCFANSVFAMSDDQLQKERIDTIKKYIRLLGKGDYRTIPTLFTDHAVAVSATGESDGIDHFYENMFKKSFSSPESKLINVFDGRLKGNMMSAYYNLSWVNHQGGLESSKFMDLFIFQADSAKIKTIYVFSNSFKQEAFVS